MKTISFKQFMMLQARYIQYVAFIRQVELVEIAVQVAPELRQRILSKYNLSQSEV